MSSGVRVLGLKSDLILVVFVTALASGWVLYLSMLERGDLWGAQWVTHVDSAVFMYGGQQILDGQVPYKDFWDHKGPMIYLVNAIGLTIGRGTTWGILVFEFFALWLGSLLIFDSIRRFAGEGIGIAASAFYIFSISKSLDRGNLTEEYAVVLVVLTIWIAIRSLPLPTFWTGFGIGLFGSLAALFKATYVATPAVVGLALILLLVKEGQTQRVMRIALGAATGFALPFAFAAVYFMANNAFGDAYYAFWTFNLQYKNITNNPLDQLLTFSMDLLSPTAAYVFALPGWIIALTYVKQCSSKSLRLAAYTVLLALPLELFLLVLSGRMFRHYSTMMIPVLVISAAIFLDAMVTSNASVKEHDEDENAGSLRNQLIPVALVVGIIALPLMQGFVAQDLATRNTNLIQVVTDIKVLTDDDDTIQTWQSSPMLYALTERAAPTRFSFEGSFENHDRSVDFIAEFTSGIKTTPPQMIVEQIGKSRLLPPLNRTEMEANISAGSEYSMDLMSLLDFVEENYQSVPAPDGWRYFLLVPSPGESGILRARMTYQELVSLPVFITHEGTQRRMESRIAARRYGQGRDGSLVGGGVWGNGLGGKGSKLSSPIIM